MGRRRSLAALTAATALALPGAAAAAPTWSTSGGLGGGTVLHLAVDAAAPTHALAVVQGPEGADPRTRLYETLDAGRSWTVGAADVAGAPLDDTTTIAIAGGVLFASHITSSGPCRAATAAGPFVCAPAGGGFRSLVAVPGQPGVLLSTFVDLQRSVDGGATWAPPAGFTPDGVLAADPSAPGAVYGTTSSRVMRSVDGGVTWGTVTQAPVCQPGTDRALQPALLADPAHPGRLYARTLQPAAPLCRSDDGGATWTPVAWPEASLGEAPFGSVSPGVAVTGAGTLVAGSHAGAHRSTDGGATWSRLADLGERVIGPVAAAGSTVYVGSDGRGVFVSDDDGATWRHAGSGLPPMPLAGIALLFTPGSDVIYGALGNELLRSDDGGASWQPGLGGATAIEPLAVDPVDGTLFAWAVDQGGGDPRLVRSTDGGRSFAALARGAPFTRPPRELHVSRSRPRVLTVWAEVGGRLWRSTDDGVSWRVAGRLHGFTALAFDAGDPLRIRALVRVPGGNVLYATTNGGAGWRRALPGNGNDSVDADPTVPGALWLRTGGGLLRGSTDGGRRFTRQPEALPIASLAIAGRTLVANLERTDAARRPGLFATLPRNLLAASNDRGRSWTIVDAPLEARLRVTAGASLLLAEGQNGIVRRAPLPLATVRLLRPPRVLGPARTGETLRCGPARFAGPVQASTTAVGAPGVGPIAGARYRVPRAPGFPYTCITLARTPTGLVLASSAIVRAPGRPPGGIGGGGGEG